VHTDFYPIDTTFYVVPKIKSVPLTYLRQALIRLELPLLGADSAVPGLNRNIAYMSRILVPSPAVLHAFDCQATALADRIHQSEQQNQTISALRDALLPRLVSGELRVSAAERIVGRCA
jgi:type I restriction enzyme S subunit